MLPTLTPCRGCIPEHQATFPCPNSEQEPVYVSITKPLFHWRSGERPSTDHSVQDAVVAIEALTFAERQLVVAEHIEDPACVKGSWTVIVAQVERTDGLACVYSWLIPTVERVLDQVRLAFSVRPWPVRFCNLTIPAW